MLVTSTQQQWAVGQGFFHTGALRDADGHDVMSYAVDCGTVTDIDLIYREIRSIETGVSYAPPLKHLDLVFLSHFDADHINGVEELHGRLAPRQYVIPKVSLVGRLFTAARVLSSMRWYPSDWWYWDFITDPDGWLRSLPGRPVVTIVDPDLNSDGQVPLVERVITDRVGAGGIGTWTASSGSVPNGTHVAGITAPGGPGRRDVWVWQTYVAEAARSDLLGFEARLIRSAGFNPNGPQSQIRAIIDTHWEELVTAYAMSSYRRNRASLCVYSGPAPWVPVKVVRDPLPAGPGVPKWTGSAGPGWLGAGDAHLKSETSAKEFTDAFALVLDQVGTFAIPHHGAKSSWNDWLLDAFVSAGIALPMTVVGAQPGHRTSWEHPAAVVEAAVAARGGRLVVTTRERRSRWASRTTVHF